MRDFKGTTFRFSATLIVGTLTPLLAGCGTFSTLSKDDSEIKYGLSQYKTSCSSLPRVYSGVSYDICKANSSTTDFTKQLKEMLYYADILPSAICDTAALPYSIYKQNKDGNLALK